MERVYKRNQHSYRPQRNDSREDYQSGKKEFGKRFTHFSADEEEHGYGRSYRKGAMEEGRGQMRDRRRETEERGPVRSYRRDTEERGQTRGFRRDAEERGQARGFRRDAEERGQMRGFRRDTEGRGQMRGFRRDAEERGAGRSYGGEVEERRYSRGYDKENREQGKGNTRVYQRGVDREERREYREDKRREDRVRNQEWISDEEKKRRQEKHYSKKKILAHRLKNQDENTELRLNRFISMGGVCSRRDADELILAGRVKVNGEVVQTVGQKVYMSDCVEVDNVQVLPEKKVYLVLNKPKDYVTTVEDPLERKTVMSLIENACKERIYPVGRLDRQTTGVLLFTNDGDLAKKLTHPKYDHKKIYHVFLDKPLLEEDLKTIASGVELEDGFIKADEIEYTSSDHTEVGIEIHSGKNRIVRRIFEHLGYQILKLDRVYFAGITKKNLPRGTWRFLTQQEVNILKVY